MAWVRTVSSAGRAGRARCSRGGCAASGRARARPGRGRARARCCTPPAGALEVVSLGAQTLEVGAVVAVLLLHDLDRHRGHAALAGADRRGRGSAPPSACGPRAPPGVFSRNFARPVRAQVGLSAWTRSTLAAISIRRGSSARCGSWKRSSRWSISAVERRGVPAAGSPAPRYAPRRRISSSQLRRVSRLGRPAQASPKLHLPAAAEVEAVAVKDARRAGVGHGQLGQGGGGVDRVGEVHGVCSAGWGSSLAPCQEHAPCQAGIAPGRPGSRPPLTI